MKLKSELIIVNVITFIRMPFIFLFLLGAVCHGRYLQLTGESMGWLALLSLAAMIIASFTDLFDGLLARRWNVVTKFGAMADPLMDKVFYLVVFPAFIWLLPICRPEEHWHVLVMMILTVLYMLRDQWVTFLRSVGALYNADCAATMLGKVRTAMSFPLGAVIYYYIVFEPWFLPQWLIYAGEVVAIFLNVWSMYVYTRNYLPYIRKAMDIQPQ